MSSQLPYKTLMEGKWSPGWTHIMPFQVGGLGNSDPHFIVYNSATGEVHFDRFYNTGTGFNILYKSKWGKGWSHLMPFTVGSQPHFIAYNNTTGEVHFDRIHNDGKGFDILYQSKWGKGWSHLIPFTLDQQPRFIAYNSTTGEVHFDRIHNDGKGFDILQKGKWSDGWTHLKPFTMGDQPFNEKIWPHLTAYNTTTGQVHFDRIRPGGQGIDILYDDIWGKGWSHLMHFWLPAQDKYTQKRIELWFFIAYNNKSGEVHFDQIDRGGTGFKIKHKSIWGKGWSHLVPLYYESSKDLLTFGAYFLAYNTTTGEVHFNEIVKDALITP
jgi:hypothetical protein